MRSGWVVCGVLVANSIAAADDEPMPNGIPRLIAGLGGGYAVSPGHTRITYAAIEAGYRAAASIPVAVHATVLAGSWKLRDFDTYTVTGQPWLQVRIGGEVYGCGPFACGFVDVDVGYQRVSNIAVDTNASGTEQNAPVTRAGVIVAGRAGVDFGSVIYLRLAVGGARSVIGDFAERNHTIAYDWGRTLTFEAALIGRF